MVLSVHCALSTQLPSLNNMVSYPLRNLSSKQSFFLCMELITIMPISLSTIRGWKIINETLNVNLEIWIYRYGLFKCLYPSPLPPTNPDCYLIFTVLLMSYIYYCMWFINDVQLNCHLHLQWMLNKGATKIHNEEQVLEFKPHVNI